MPHWLRYVRRHERLVAAQPVYLGAELFGGDFDLQQIHHATMWFFIVFSIIPRLPGILPIT